MSRDEEVRQQALERDDHRCQITGKRENLVVHHWKRLGMGGSEELDTVENAITLDAELHTMWIHPAVSVPLMRIIHWNPIDKVGGLIVEQREEQDIGEEGKIILSAWQKTPRGELWFYRRRDAELLEQEIEMVRQVQLVESKHAAIMAHIWDNYDLVSDAKSPEQFVAGLGLDSNRAKDEAKAARWVKENSVEWPEGVNVKKILLVASINPMDILLYRDVNSEQRIMQEFLDQAVDMSYSDLRKELIEKGLKLAKMQWYLVLCSGRGLLGQSWSKTLFVRSRNRELVLHKLADRRQALRRVFANEKLLEINAFRAGIRWDRKTQKLYDAQGNEIYYETWREGGEEE